MTKALAGAPKGAPAIQMPAALPFDSAAKFQFLEFARTQEGKVQFDKLTIPMPAEGDDSDDHHHQGTSSRPLWSGISSAFQSIIEVSSSALKFKRIVGGLLVISSKDGLHPGVV